MENIRQKIEMRRNSEIEKTSLDFYLTAYDVEEKDNIFTYQDLEVLLEKSGKNGEFPYMPYLEEKAYFDEADPSAGPGKVIGIIYVSRPIRDDIGLQSDYVNYDFYASNGEEHDCRESIALTWEEYVSLGKPRVISERRIISAKWL